MGKRGPKRKYKSAFDFGKAVNDFFEDCEERGVFPDEAGMFLFLGVRPVTVKRYCEDPDPVEAERFEEILENAKLQRESWLNQAMTANPKGSIGYMSLLKQQKNGGYVDKPVDTSERSLTIVVNNVGGEAAFK